MIMILRYVSNHSKTRTMCYLPPGDGPLLETNELPSLAGQRDFREIDGDLSRADTDTEAVDDATNDKHGNVLRGADDDASDDPDDGSNLDGGLTCEVPNESELSGCS